MPGPCYDIVVYEAADAADADRARDGTRALLQTFPGFIAVTPFTGSDAQEPRPVAAGAGIEIGRFRLKPGIPEQEMRAAYAAMLASLAVQPGWRGQHLVRLTDGTFLDLAFADDQERSEALCAAWAGNPDCDRFLALIEPESMEFGTIL